MNESWVQDRIREWEDKRRGFTEQWVIEVRSGDHWDNNKRRWLPWYEATSDTFMLPISLEGCIYRIEQASKDTLVGRIPEDYRLWNVVTDERIPIAILGL